MPLSQVFPPPPSRDIPFSIIHCSSTCPALGKLVGTLGAGDGEGEDSGESGESGDSGNSGDSGDSGNTGDTGDSGVGIGDGGDVKLCKG